MQMYSRVAIEKTSLYWYGTTPGAEVAQRLPLSIKPYTGNVVLLKRKEIWLWKACWALGEAVVVTHEKDLAFNKRD